MRDRYIQDTRIHCCLYFINPTGHSLRPIDVIVMKKLSEVVNVVPVIAKSDSLTLDERERFKAKIREELVYNSIRLYPFDTDEDDEEEVQLNESIRVGLFQFLVLINTISDATAYSMSFPLLSSAPRAMWSLTARRFVVARIAGVL